MSAWRDRLVPASFKGIEFHVEAGAISGGRRTVLHEFPKRDSVYVEDMGRRGRRYQITGYLVGPDFIYARDDLIRALEDEGSGTLVHPTHGEFDVVLVEFSETERRERGGYAEIEMVFMEAGEDQAIAFVVDTRALVNKAADELDGVTVRGLDASLGLAAKRTSRYPLCLTCRFRK